MTFLEMINSKDRSKFALPNEALPSKAIGKCEACTSWQFSSVTEAKGHISILHISILHRNYEKDEMSSLDQSVFTCKYKGCSMKFSTQYQLANHKSNLNHYIRKRPNSSKKDDCAELIEKKRKATKQSICIFFNKNSVLEEVLDKELDVMEVEEEDIWECEWCGQDWNDNDGNRWILCDVCDKRFHLQCFGIQYKEEEYYDIDIDNVTFHCETCKK